MSDCDSLIQIFRFSGIQKIDRYSGRRKGPGKGLCCFIMFFLFKILLILNVRNVYVIRQSVIYLFTNFENY